MRYLLFIYLSARYVLYDWLYIFVLAFVAFSTPEMITSREGIRELSPSQHVAMAFEDCDLYCTRTISVGGEEQVQDGRTVYEILFGCSGSFCVIKDSPGGNLDVYALAAKGALRLPANLFLIKGKCMSACTVFADIARRRVCRYPGAVFGFHQGYRSKEIKTLPSGEKKKEYLGRFTPDYSPDIKTRVEQIGGFPTDGFTYMKPRDSASFWRECSVIEQMVAFTVSPP